MKFNEIQSAFFHVRFFFNFFFNSVLFVSMKLFAFSLEDSSDRHARNQMSDLGTYTANFSPAKILWVNLPLLFWEAWCKNAIIHPVGSAENVT